MSEDLQHLYQSFNEESSLPPIIIVEDDETLSFALSSYLKKFFSLDVLVFKRPSEFTEYINENLELQTFSLVTDISFGNGIDGLMLIDLLREKKLDFIPIVMTGFASIETAITATKKGVFHYLTKPFELSSLVELIKSAYKQKFGALISDKILLDSNSLEEKEVNLNLKKSYKIEPPKNEDMFCGMIGRSKQMSRVFERIQKVACSNSTVLINGPSGTGKELVANSIHRLSKRCSNSLVSVNCGAIPSELLESELFGHRKGAFTGAITDRVGRFEAANNSTIFLDEIGDMPLLLQVKILRVLQSREIEIVGSSKTQKVDVRILTATHRDLEKAVNEGDFREDLFYRLNVIPIKVPALSQRREDIPLLISHFLSRFVSADGSNNIDFDPKVLDIFMSYDWPGNVRELENLIERLVILRGGERIREVDLPAKFLDVKIKNQLEAMIELPDEGIDLKSTLKEIEVSLIEQALSLTDGNKNQASKLLKMNRTTLIEKMKKWDMLFS